jgi:hypothetical protein
VTKLRLRDRWPLGDTLAALQKVDLIGARCGEQLVHRHAEGARHLHKHGEGLPLPISGWRSSNAATPRRRPILVMTLETTPRQSRRKEAMHRTVSVYMADEIVLVQPVHYQHAPGVIPFSIRHTVTSQGFRGFPTYSETSQVFGCDEWKTVKTRGFLLVVTL